MDRWSDEQFDQVLAGVLRAGVIASGAIVALGGLLFLWRHGLEQASYGVFRGEPGGYSSVVGIMREARGLSGRGLIQLGLLMLIATPIARVVFAVFGFLRQRDWLYVGISALVLGLLAYSLLSPA